MRARVMFVALGVAAGFAACGDEDRSSPAAPSAFLGSPRTIQISGNLTLTGVGQTSQLTATATFTTDTPRNVTNQVKWEVSNPSVATITAGGLLRAVSVGEAQVTASFRGVTSAARGVSVKPAVTGLVVTGPVQMTPGSIEQFKAAEQLSDGSSRDVTDSVSWFYEYSRVLRHLGGGRFEAGERGEARVWARSGNRSAPQITVLILPSGTFKLSGTVTDVAGTLSNVRVDLVSGTGAPQSTWTLNGAYALYGVAGQIRLRISSEGYQPEEQAIDVTGHAVRDFSLVTANPIVDVSGNWTLRLSATAACSGAWPEVVRRIEVGVAISQRDTRIEVTFSGPTLQHPNPISGAIAGTAFSLQVYGDTYYYGPLYILLNRPTPTDWVGVYGFIHGTATPSEVRGEFSGSFDYYTTPANMGFVTGQPQRCPADSNLDLRR